MFPEGGVESAVIVVAGQSVFLSLQVGDENSISSAQALPCIRIT